jgi:hypothetical protein
MPALPFSIRIGTGKGNNALDGTILVAFLLARVPL